MSSEEASLPYNDVTVILLYLIETKETMWFEEHYCKAKHSAWMSTKRCLICISINPKIQLHEDKYTCAESFKCAGVDTEVRSWVTSRACFPFNCIDIFRGITTWRKSIKRLPSPHILRPEMSCNDTFKHNCHLHAQLKNFSRAYCISGHFRTKV